MTTPVDGKSKIIILFKKIRRISKCFKSTLKIKTLFPARLVTKRAKLYCVLSYLVANKDSRVKGKRDTLYGAVKNKS